MRLNLRTYLFVCLGVIAVLPALFLGGVLTQRAETLQLEQSDRESALAAEALARATAQLMLAHTHAVRALSRQVEAAATLDGAELQDIVSAQHHAAPTLGNMWVANAVGTSVANDPPFDAQGKPTTGVDYSDRDYYKKVSAANATSYSRAQLGRTTGRPNLQVVDPVRDRQGNFIGFSQGAVDLGELQVLAEQVLAQSTGLRAVVLDAEGRVLAHPDETARGEMRDLSAVAVYGAASREDAELRSGQDESGVAIRAAVAPVLPGVLDWTVLVTRTEAELQAHTADIRRETLLTAAAALLAGLSLAGILAAFLSRPIVRLASLVVAVGHGDFTDVPPPPRLWLPREVGTLIMAIRDMVVQLRARTEELERRVSERTADLTRANQELDQSFRELRAARDEAEEAQQRYSSLFEHNTDAVFGFDLDGRFSSANAAGESLFGYQTGELRELSFGDLVAAADRDRAEEVVRQAAQGEPRSIDVSVVSKSDERVDLQVNTMPVFVGRRIVGVFGIAKDVTVRKRIEQALEYQALHDGLTDLPNRTLLYDRLDVAIQQARRDFETVALLLIDLDRFKAVNDTLGHQAGDELLREIAARLRKSLRASDTVARLGGDEFAVVLPRTDAEGGAIVASALLREIGQPVELDGGTVTVGASIGLAVGLEDAADAEGLLRCADVAMFAAKRAGIGCRRYGPELREDSGDRPALVADLGRAIEQDELILHYQPKVSLHTGRLVRVEALVRWQHPERGFLPPDVFIPLAESSEQIDALSQWVLNAALSQCNTWRAAGLDLPVSVNLSVRNLQDVTLPDKIASLLDRWSLPPDALLLEITEHGLMASESQCVDVLGRLRSMGICIAIDDFGVGNAALAYLRRLPVDFLKIDKSFVIDMLRNERDDAIVRSTIELAHSLGLAVVAEGVEDVETLHRLKTLGCDLAQGYYMARPLPPSGLAEWLSTSEWASDDNLTKAS